MTNIIKRDRTLKNEEDIFNHNAWDDVEWTESMYREANDKIQAQRNSPEEEDSRQDIELAESDVIRKWDEFYKAHGDKFFKDRQWIFSEFPELLEYLRADSPSCQIFEVGCGVGNAVVHILKANANSDLKIYACDLSHNAINLLNEREIFGQNATNIVAFQADVCRDFQSKIKGIVPANSLDFITLIFALSALKPELMQQTIRDLATLLKPGGCIFFRDYAQYDLTQLRFKGKSYLRDNYYIRSDGTTSYFFTNQVVDGLFSGAGLVQVELKNDNRVLVNRLKAIKMYRCWIQAKYRKPP